MREPIIELIRNFQLHRYVTVKTFIRTMKNLRNNKTTSLIPSDRTKSKLTPAKKQNIADEQK